MLNSISGSYPHLSFSAADSNIFLWKLSEGRSSTIYTTLIA